MFRFIPVSMFLVGKKPRARESKEINIFSYSYVMEIECQGCYYTLCSFVCLTEDLSEILQFLWRHGCLRKSYYCEKCGRKCAIGDKDLFFRCNRNTLETPVTRPEEGNLSLQQGAQQATSQIQTNRNQSVLPNDHHQYIIHPHSGDVSQQNRISVESTNSENLMIINNNDNLQYSGLLHRNEAIQNSSVNVASVSSSALTHNELNQNDAIFTVIDTKENQVIQDSSGILERKEFSASVLPVLQVQSDAKFLEAKLRDSIEEPCAKVQKKANKLESGKPAKKRCNFKVSMKKGTFFEKSKLPIDTVCKFVVFWCCMKHPTQEFLRNELSLATRTVVDWSTACREICIHWAKSVSEKIGGDGVMVQVDEVKIQEKDSKQNDNGNRFSFWGIEKDKEKGKIFIVPVPACDSWSLLTVINDWILPGSVIISNCWKAYDCLKLQEFIQQTVVQSKTFVHPQNNCGPQNFDGKVDEAGASAGGELQMPRFGTRRSHHLGDLAEFMFKRRYSNHLERMHAFFKQISLVYPLH